MSVSTSGSISVKMAEAQHIGYNQQRTTLEDRCMQVKLRTAAGLDLFIGLVADGIGGASAGELAGEKTKETVLSYLRGSTSRDVNEVLRNALLAAHNEVSRMAEEDIRLRSMGTTATLAAIHEGKLYLAHLGDSRAYLIREGKIKQLTLDHSWGNEKVRMGQFSLEEVAEHPRRDELARYIGQPGTPEIDIGLRLSADSHPARSQLNSDGLPLLPGDSVLLCTDGLIKERRGAQGHYVEAREIIEILQSNEVQDAANTLVSKALGRYVDDNVSVVILEVPGAKKKFAIKGRSNVKILAVVIAIAVVCVLASILALLGVLVLRPGAKPTASPAPTETIPPNALTVLTVHGELSYQLPGQAEIPISDPGQIHELVAGTRLVCRSGTAGMQFPDGSTLFLASDSAIVIQKLANPDEGEFDTVFQLEKGRLITHLGSDGGSVGFNIRYGADVYQARVTGSVMGVSFAGGGIDISCFEGHCTLLENGQPLLDFFGNQHVRVENGVPILPDGRLDCGGAYAELAEYHGLLGICNAPTPTPHTAGGRELTATITATRNPRTLTPTVVEQDTPIVILPTHTLTPVPPTDPPPTDPPPTDPPPTDPPPTDPPPTDPPPPPPEDTQEPGG